MENLTAANSTEDHTVGNTTETTANGYGLFFDPAWQLALTVEFYFRYVIIAAGIFGTAANGLVLYALIV